MRGWVGRCTPGAPRRDRQRAPAALLAALVVALVVGGAPPSAAQDPGPAEVALRGVALDPWVAADGTWTFDLAVEGAPPGATIAGSLYERVPSRRALYRTFFGLVDGGRLATIPRQELAPTLTVEGVGTAARLRISLGSGQRTGPGHRLLPDGLAPGVYPVEVEVDSADDEPLGRVIVYLTRVSDDDERDPDDPPLLVAPVLPVGGPPSIDPSGAAEADPATVTQVAAVADGLALTDLPATLVPRPETVEALARPGGTDALRSLVRASTSRQVVDGPYVDVPINAWIQRDMSDELTRQRERGNSILTARLGRVDSSIWLSRDGLSPEAARELWSVGVRTVILGPGTTREPDDSDGTAPAAVSAGPTRTLEAVTADAGLSLALERSALGGSPLDPIRDDNGLAAELAVIDGSREGPAGVALLAPEGWPSDTTAVVRLATVLQGPLSPTEAATVDDLVTAVASDGTRALTPEPSPDLGNYPQLAAIARARLSSFTALLGGADPEVDALDQRLLLSGARSLSPADEEAYVDSVLTTVATRLAEVQAPPEQTITLTARDADIPLTLRNGLASPVTVLIELEADSRVEFRGEGSRITRLLAPGDQEVRIPIRTRVPGDAPIDITIRTPDGVELDRVEYTVRSTAISGIGIVLSAGAAGFLLLWWARHWTQARRARRADATGGPAADGAAET